MALVLIGFSQTAGDARTFAARHRYRIDINQESVAQGMANVGAGLFQGMPVSTSLSASSLNDHTGARTGLRVAHLRRDRPAHAAGAGAAVLDLPKPVLAALIIEAVVMGMMDVPEMRRLARVQRFDFWIAIAAIAATLLVGVLAGVMIGIGLSLIWLISGGDAPPHAAAGTGARHAGLPGAGRAPRRRAVPRGRGPPAGRRPVLRHLGRPGGPGPGGRVVDARHHRDRARLRGNRLHRLARGRRR